MSPRMRIIHSNAVDVERGVAHRTGVGCIRGALLQRRQQLAVVADRGGAEALVDAPVERGIRGYDRFADGGLEFAVERHDSLRQTVGAAEIGHADDDDGVDVGRPFGDSSSSVARGNRLRE